MDLYHRLKEKHVQAPTSWWNDIHKKITENDAKFAKRLNTPRQPMGFYGAYRVIKDFMDQHHEVYMVSEGANTLDIGRDVVNMYEPRHRLDSGSWGVMGIGTGYAIGAAVESGHPVLCCAGDSAFGFDGMDVETICRYHLPVIIIVFNNGGIYNGVDAHFSSKEHQPAPTVLDAKGRYDYLATAFGGKGYNVTTPEELEEALDDAYQTHQPAVINAIIDPTLGAQSGHLTKFNPKVTK